MDDVTNAKGSAERPPVRDREGPLPGNAPATDDVLTAPALFEGEDGFWQELDVAVAAMRRGKPAS